MSKSNDGGFAFPCTGEAADARYYVDKGVTLRDYFAAKAMAGIFANPKLCDVLERQNVTVWVSRRAYQVADAMLATRDEQSLPPCDNGAKR